MTSTLLSSASTSTREAAETAGVVDTDKSVPLPNSSNEVKGSSGLATQNEVQGLIAATQIEVQGPLAAAQESTDSPPLLSPSLYPLSVDWGYWSALSMSDEIKGEHQSHQRRKARSAAGDALIVEHENKNLVSAVDQSEEAEANVTAREEARQVRYQATRKPKFDASSSNTETTDPRRPASTPPNPRPVALPKPTQPILLSAVVVGTNGDDEHGERSSGDKPDANADRTEQPASFTEPADLFDAADTGAGHAHRACVERKPLRSTLSTHGRITDAHTSEGFEYIVAGALSHAIVSSEPSKAIASSVRAQLTECDTKDPSSVPEIILGAQAATWRRLENMKTKIDDVTDAQLDATEALSGFAPRCRAARRRCVRNWFWYLGPRILQCVILCYAAHLLFGAYELYDRFHCVSWVSSGNFFLDAGETILNYGIDVVEDLRRATHYVNHVANQTLHAMIGYYTVPFNYTPGVASVAEGLCLFGTEDEVRQVLGARLRPRGHEHFGWILRAFNIPSYFFLVISICAAFLGLIVPVYRWEIYRSPDETIRRFIARFTAAWVGSNDDMPIVHGAILLPKLELVVPDAEVSAAEAAGWFRVGTRGPAKNPQFIEAIGLVFPYNPPMVPANSPENSMASILRRLGGQKLSDGRLLGGFAAFLDYFYDDEVSVVYKAYGCPMCAYAVTKYGSTADAHSRVYDEWNSIERIKRSAAILHDQAAERTAVNASLKSDDVVKMFVKTEPYFKCGPSETETPDWRGIINCSDAYHTALGPSFYALSKLLAQRWNPGYWITYASGITPRAAAGAGANEGETYYVGDVSRFDRGLDATTLEVLVEKTEKWHSVGSVARRALRSQLRTTGYAQNGGHRFKLRGQRRSGDDNTSVHNSIINVAAHVFAIMVTLKLTLAQVKAAYRFLVLGDDIVISGPHALRQVPFAKTLALINWTCKEKYVDSPQQLEFCSRFRWPHNFGYSYSDKPGRFFTRFGWNVTGSAVDLYAKAYCSHLNNSHVPFVRVYLWHIMDTIGGTKPADIRTPEWAFAAEDRHLVATDETWKMFYDIYGLTRKDEDDFAAWLISWKGGPAIGTHRHIEHILRVEGFPQ